MTTLWRLISGDSFQIKQSNQCHWELHRRADLATSVDVLKSLIIRLFMASQIAHYDTPPINNNISYDKGSLKFVQYKKLY